VGRRGLGRRGRGRRVAFDRGATFDHIRAPSDGRLYPLVRSNKDTRVVSSTKQTRRRRRTRARQRGRWNKKLGPSTPVFPVHPEGYDSSAPDAKKQAES
jgi:hypothetical protein